MPLNEKMLTLTPIHFRVVTKRLKDLEKAKISSNQIALELAKELIANGAIFCTGAQKSINEDSYSFRFYLHGFTKRPGIQFEDNI